MDAGLIPYTSFVALYDAGAPVKVIAGGGIQGCILVAQPGLDTPDKLKGKTLGAFFRQEIAAPLGADFWIGLPATEDHRVADIVPFELPAAAACAQLSEIQTVSLSDTRIEIPWSKTRAWRSAEIPAVNGYGNARSIVEIHTLLSNGGVAKGRRLMSEAGCRKALERQPIGAVR